MMKHYTFTRIVCTLMALQLICTSNFAKAWQKNPASTQTSSELPWVQHSKLNAADEIVNKRSQKTKHYQMPNGNTKMISSTGSLHYEVNGQWQEIGYNILPNNSGLYPQNPYYNQENSFKTYYPSNPISGKIITSLKEGVMSEQLESVYAIDQNGNTVYQYSANASQNIATNQAQLSYQNVFSNASINYTQQSDGRKFDFVIQNNQFLQALPASAKFLVIKEKMNIPASWTITETANGYDIYQAGTWIANLPQPVAYEKMSTTKTYENDADFMKEGSMSMSKVGNVITLYTKFDLSWLKSSERNFPISLDPVVSYYPFNVSMATGRITTAGGGKTSGDLRLAAAGTASISWAKFDIATLPPGATLISGSYYGYHYSGSGAVKNAAIVGMQTVDPVAATNVAITAQIGTTGPIYNTACPFGAATSLWYSGPVNGAGLADISAQQSQGWTAFGFKYASGNTGTMLQRGYNAATTTERPYLELDYSTTGCTTVTGGISTASVTLACGDPFNLNLTGNSTGTGTTFQWLSSPAGANTWSLLGAAQASPFYTTTQSSPTDYRCVVTCTTSLAFDTSIVVAVGQNTVINCYCTPTGAPTSTNYITSFVTTGAAANINNPNNIYTTSPVAGYGNYTAMTLSANPGSTVNVSISFVTGSHAVGLWVDWNQDGDFNDAGENPLTTASALTTSPFVGSFTVPPTALVGNTRLRIRTSAISGPAPVCGLNTNGEAEDYTMNILGPCTTATAGTISPAAYVICPMTTQILTATTPVIQLGTTFQWKSSTVSGGPYTNVVGGTGATTLNYTTAPLPTGTYYYVLESTCANCGPCSVLSNEISILSQDVQAPIATNSAQCAPGIPTAFVTSAAGAIGTGNYNWYNAAIGGTLLQSKPYGPLAQYYLNDFNTAALGAATITGNTSITGNTLQLFPNTTSQYGSFTTNPPTYTWDKMQVDFDLTTVGTVSNMADGVSFSFGNDVVSTAEAAMNAENGTGTKVKLAFVAYTNGTAVQGIYLMYNSTVNEPLPTSTGVLAYSADVSWKNSTKHITFSIDSLGKANLSVGGVAIFTNISMPAAYLSTTVVNTRPNWKAVIKGRTGAVSMGASIDNMDMKLSTLITGSPTYLSSVSTTTTFYVAELGTNGCYSARTPVTVTVNTPPTISINPIPNDSVCTGAPVTLSASGASTYLWNGSATSVNGDTTFASAVAGIYTVTGTDANSCSSTSTIFIYLHPVLTGTTTASPSALCLGASTSLDATAIPICTGLYTPNFVGYYTPALWTLTNYTSDGTSNFTGAPANIKLNTGTLVTQPGGGSTTLSRTITCTGNITFNWSFNHPLDAYADFPQYSINGIAYAFPTYNMSLFGVTQTGTMTIPVVDGDLFALEVVTIDNDALSAQLTVSNFVAPSPKITGTISYWDAPTGGTNLGVPPLTVTPTSAGTITYYAEFTTITTACPNLVRQPAVVTVHALPTATVSGGGAVCSGATMPDVTIMLTGNGPWNIVYSDGTNTVPVNGIVSSPYVISNAAPGTYSVSSVNDANCTGTTSGSVSVSILPLPTATVSGGGMVCNGVTLPNVQIDLTGSGPWNLTYTDGTTPVTANGFAGTTYTIAGATGTYNVLTISDANCTGTASGTATVGFHPVPNVTATISPASICYGNSAIANGGGAVSYAWDNGITDNTPFVATATTTYVVTGTDANLCTATSSASITVTTLSTNLSQSSAGNTISNTGTQNGTSTQPDGSTIMYSDPSCDLIASVQDQAGGNALGSTTATVTVEPSVLTYLGQPYTRRWFTITPTNNVGVNANVTIYQTQDDFDDYNAANGAYPDLPTGPTDVAGMANVAVTKVTGGSLGVGAGTIVPISVIWNATTNYWEITFNVSGTFSQFYVHAANPLGSALAATIVNFNGTKVQGHDVLTWTTSSEQNNAYFNLQYSTDGIHFDNLAKVNTKAWGGNSSSNLSYSATNTNPTFGHNYYRLEQVDIDGQKAINSKIVDLIWANNETTVNIYPNPMGEIVTIDLYAQNAEKMLIHIKDMSGRVIKKVQFETVKGLNSFPISVSHLAHGMYTLDLVSQGKVIYTEKLSK